MVRCCALALIAAGMLSAGCRTAPQSAASTIAPPPGPTKQFPLQPPEPPAVRRVVFQEPLPAVEETAPRFIDTAEELGLQEFVGEVVARHPSVQAMTAAWQAAAQRYPQVVALDDPMFMMMTAPGSYNSATTEGAYILELRQRFPWFGKRGLRGEAALEGAAAAAHDLQDARLRIILVAQLAYFDYYLADQQLGLNDKNLDLMKEFRESARIRYQNNQVTQQDVLQADVELAELARRNLEISRMKRVAMARVNTLLLRTPDAPLPRPALSVSADQLNDDTALLHSWALQHRPDLAALSHRVEMESANLELAYKQYYPDVEVFGRYDTFWQPASTQGPLRGQVGVSTNLPIFRQRLSAAVCEAQFRLQRQRAEYEQLANDIRLEVQTAWEQIRESQQVLELYDKQLLPAAEQYLSAARSNYEVGKATFLDIVQAQRQLVMAREKQVEAKAMLAQRIVELERNVGGNLPREVR